MNVQNEFDPPLVAGMAFGALNLLNLLAWVVGLHVPVSLYAITLIATLGYGLWNARAKLLIVCGLLVVFILITLNDPVTGWDARSIWFFHAKRIFLHHSLYAALDGYAPWTHNDYPTLVPAIAASIAASAGYWNDVLPRAAEVFALAPALFFGAYIFRTIGSFCIWLSLVMVVCWGEVLGGYMDSLIAVYFSIAVVAMTEIYRHQRHQTSANASIGLSSWSLVLALSLLNLLLLKNEGLALSAIVFVCMLPAMLNQRRLIAPMLSSFVVFALLWKLPTLHAGVSTDLIQEGGQLQRGWHRLTTWADVSLILKSFQQFSLWYALALTGLAFYALIKRRQFAYLLPAIGAVLAYAMVLMSVYLTTYHQLQWHLSTSVDRVLMAVNLASATLVLLALGDILNQMRHSPYWGAPSKT